MKAMLKQAVKRKIVHQVKILDVLFKEKKKGSFQKTESI